MITIDEDTYKRMPERLRAMCEKLPNPGSDEVLAGFPAETGKSSGARVAKSTLFGIDAQPEINTGKGDSGSAARYFYCAKASKKERRGSAHPTVKPIKLMRYLCRLITPPGGIVLDPFAGTGTTGEAALLEGFNPILIEREEAYIRDIHQRMSEVYSEMEAAQPAKPKVRQRTRREP